MTSAIIHHGKARAVTRVNKAAWINKPKTDSNRSETPALQENTLIPGMMAYGPSEGRRSSDILEADFLDPASQMSGNYNNSLS